MNRLLAVTNALLAVIALCLCLVVAKMYDLTSVTSMHAQPSTHAVSASTPLAVRVVNDQLPCTMEGPVDARIHMYDGISWDPVRGRYGLLAVKPHEE